MHVGTCARMIGFLDRFVVNEYIYSRSLYFGKHAHLEGGELLQS
jgi:hypothetical protein